MGPQTGQRDTGDSTRALVIRSTAYRDADRIVTLLTENAGRISVLGRKARQSYRRFGGALEPFALIRVRVAPARGDLYYAREAQIVSVYRGVLASWSKMAAAASSLRWLARCAPENHADPDVFETTVAMLETLNTSPSTLAENLTIAHQIRTLGLWGLRPQVDTCACCGRRVPEDRSALFDPVYGAVVCRACGGGILRLAPEARVALSAATGLAPFRDVGWSPGVAQALQQAIDLMSHHHLVGPVQSTQAGTRSKTVHRVA